jgi:hypothetical protein
MGIDDRRWDAESNAAVHTALALPGMLSIALVGDHVITAEACLFGIGRRDERLLCGEFQLESVGQTLAELTFDGFGFWLGSREAEQDVIRVAGVTEPSIVRVVWITLGQPLERLAELPCLGGVSCLPAPMQPFVDDARGGIGLPRFPAIVLGQERLFDALVEFVQGDIR